MWRIRRGIAIGVGALLSAGAVWALLHQQAIRDQLTVWQYQPSAAVSALADRSGMSDGGRFYFFVTRPSLENAEQFNQECRRVEQASPILGCYDQAADRIHIYNVTHPELDGIKEVTAAHEMLHAAWARMSQAERQRLGELLEAAYQRVKTDDLAARMAYYERTQPGSRANELHSIVGTEIADVGHELEQHYQQFFSNRQAVVGLHAAYHQRFTTMQREAERISGELDGRRTAIEQRSAQYAAGVAVFNNQAAVFNDRAARGDFVSQAAFQAERARLVQQSRELSTERRAIETAVAEYNQQVEKLYALGQKIQSLQQQLDSHQEVE
ncbi:MAG: hypothetical protein Q4A37_01395 [Candidatus Saccharibacteria bacterium]|nr:hypothetical protein [Candidatus Saccharibacteria bacterium]